MLICGLNEDRSLSNLVSVTLPERDQIAMQYSSLWTIVYFRKMLSSYQVNPVLYKIFLLFHLLFHQSIHLELYSQSPDRGPTLSFPEFQRYFSDVLTRCEFTDIMSHYYDNILSKTRPWINFYGLNAIEIFDVPCESKISPHH